MPLELERFGLPTTLRAVAPATLRPGAPITPGVLLCEAVFQTGALYLARSLAASGDRAAGVPLLAKIAEVRFRSPVYPGDTIHVRLTCKQKTAKETPEGGIPQGVVAWDVEVKNQNDEPVAVYTILTLVRRKEG